MRTAPANRRARGAFEGTARNPRWMEIGQALITRAQAA
jgi:hypothetical protein